MCNYYWSAALLRYNTSVLENLSQKVQIPIYVASYQTPRFRSYASVTPPLSPDLEAENRVYFLPSFDRTISHYGGYNPWYLLNEAINAFDLGKCSHILKIRTDIEITGNITHDSFREVGPSSMHAIGDRAFYATRDTFITIISSLWNNIRTKYLDRLWCDHQYIKINVTNLLSSDEYAVLNQVRLELLTLPCSLRVGEAEGGLSKRELIFHNIKKYGINESSEMCCNFIGYKHANNTKKTFITNEGIILLESLNVGPVKRFALPIKHLYRDRHNWTYVEKGTTFR